MSHVARWSLLVLLGVCLFGCGARPTQKDTAAGPTHPLVGKKAPLFSASMLDGSRFDLGETQGKVVILDFWATWCGPCREALPTLSEVAAEFRDRDVLFYAVDLDESPEVVKSFLEQAGLELTVVLDEGNDVATLYQAEAIPQTVIIDREGTVRFVHVGVSPDLRTRLTRELTELTAKSNSQSSAAAGDPSAEPTVSAENPPAEEPAAP